MAKTSEFVQYHLEFIVHSSPAILFNFISQPSGLVQWFCNDIHVHDQERYEFIWENDSQTAQVIYRKEQKNIKFRWEGFPENTFFEFRIKIDDLTKELSLIVTDFAEEDEIEDNKLLWTKQIEKLRSTLGAV
jgi:uncharacterized protein YndB with AHSA1/START domain